MKRKISVILLALASAICLAFALAACTGGNEEVKLNKAPPEIRNDYFAPSIYSLGKYICWDECINATSYKVFKGSVFIGETSEHKFFVGESSHDEKYKVKAVYGDNISDYSNETLVSKNTGITDEETLNFSDKNGFEEVYSIPADVRKVIIHKETLSDFIANFKIEDRVTDLILDLKNVNISGKAAEDYSYCIFGSSIDRNKDNWSLIFSVEGQCTVAGGNYTTSINKPKINSESKGASGGEGQGAVFGSSVVVEGTGTLTFKGGKGQNGGKGADVNILGLTYGDGGDGGDGGFALKCKYLLVDLLPGYNLELIEGIAGQNGGKGARKNFSVGLGASSALIDLSVHSGHSECDGVSGKSGKSEIQKEFVINGNLKR